MNKYFTAAFSLVLTIVLTIFCVGCATIINGRTENVQVTSDPPDATVTDGIAVTQTPATLVLERDHDYVLTITKSGYETQHVKIVHVVSGVVALNIVSFGMIGVGVDAASGACWRLDPDTIVVSLRPLSPDEMVLEAARLNDDTLQSKLKQLLLLKEQHYLDEDEYDSLRAFTVQCVA